MGNSLTFKVFIIKNYTQMQILFLNCTGAHNLNFGAI